MKGRIVGLLFAGLLICIPVSALADTISITNASFSDGRHAGLTITTSDFVLNFVVPHSNVDFSLTFTGGGTIDIATHGHGVLEGAGGNGFSFPPAYNPPPATTADNLLHAGFITISTPAGPSLGFTINTPGRNDGPANGNAIGNGPAGPGAGFPGVINFIGPGGGPGANHGPNSSDPPAVANTRLSLTSSNFSANTLAATPEPATLMLMATGLLIAGRSYRGRRRPS